MFLKDFHHSNLNNVQVTVEIHEPTFATFTENLARDTSLYEELEHTLLRFSRQHLVWVLSVFPIARSLVNMVGKRFPGLFQRGALTVVADTGNANTCLILETKLILSCYAKAFVPVILTGSRL